MIKKLFQAILVLGWIPTLALVTGARWMGGEPIFAQGSQGRSPIKVTRIYTGPDGKTHAEEYEIPVKPEGRGTELSTSVAATGLQFRRTNQDYYLDWHPAGRRQYVVTLSGESEIELDGGRKIRLGPGHILLAEDTTGQGHISRAIGTKDRISLFITLADGATPPR
jgi:hypothetical protein